MAMPLAPPALITIGIDPTIEVGPITVAWHGLTIAIGILVGGVVAASEARRRDLDPERLYAIGLIVAIAALIGGRVFFVVEHGLLTDPGAWFSSTGFTFYGGFIAAAASIVLYLRRERLSLAYLDAIAVGLPLGLAVGRIGDVINGEHFGPATDFFLGVRNAHPDALTPSPDLVYHSGGLYEVMLGLDRLRRRVAATPTAAAATGDDVGGRRPACGRALCGVLRSLRLAGSGSRARYRPVDQPGAARRRRSGGVVDAGALAGAAAVAGAGEPDPEARLTVPGDGRRPGGANGAASRTAPRSFPPPRSARGGRERP